MNRPKAATRRAALAAFLLFAAALLVVGPAEASRSTDPRSSLASISAATLAPSSLELASLELSLLEPLESSEPSPRFGFGEDLSLLDPERGPGGFVVFAAEAAQCELTYARNNPLKYVDPDGREFAYAGDAVFKVRITESLGRLRAAHPRLGALIRRLDESVFLHTFHPNDGGGDDRVYWPRIGVPGNNGENGVGTDTAIIVGVDLPDDKLDQLLAHELSHSEDGDSGTYSTAPDCKGCANVTESKATRMGNVTPAGRRNPDTTYRGQRVNKPTQVPPEPKGEPKRRKTTTKKVGEE